MKIRYEVILKIKNSFALRIYTGQSKLKLCCYLLLGNWLILPNKIALRPGTLICKFLPDVLNRSSGEIVWKLPCLSLVTVTLPHPIFLYTPGCNGFCQIPSTDSNPLLIIISPSWGLSSIFSEAPRLKVSTSLVESSLLNLVLLFTKSPVLCWGRENIIFNQVTKFSWLL